MIFLDFALLFLSLIFILPIIYFDKSNLGYDLKLATGLLAFYNPITNKILIVLIALIFLKLIFKTSFSNIDRDKKIIFIAGTLLLLTGLYGLSKSSSINMEDAGRYLVSPYFNSVIFSLVLSLSLKKLSDIESFIYLYAKLRFFEISIIGLYLYIFQYNDLLLYSSIINDYMKLDVDENRRLISFGFRNANEAAALLLGVIGYFFIRFYNNINIINIIYFFTTLLALFLTWTRSAWMLFVIQIFCYFAITRKIKRSIFALGITLVPAVILFVAISILTRNEQRVLSDETILLRFEMYTQYLTSLHQLPFFHGIFGDIIEITSMLDIGRQTSSENITLDIFVRHGILGGLFFIICCVYFSVNYLKILILCNTLKDNVNRESRNFGLIICLTYFAVYFMSNISLLEQGSFLWILFGLSGPLYRYLKELSCRPCKTPEPRINA